MNNNVFSFPKQYLCCGIPSTVKIWKIFQNFLIASCLETVARSFSKKAVQEIPGKGPASVFHFKKLAAGNLLIFSEHLFSRTPPNNCFCFALKDNFRDRFFFANNNFFSLSYFQKQFFYLVEKVHIYYHSIWIS